MGLDLKWLLNNSEKVKDTIVAVLSDETADDVNQMKDVLREGVDVTLDILREPAAVWGIEVPVSRGVPSQKTAVILEHLAELQEAEE